MSSNNATLATSMHNKTQLHDLTSTSMNNKMHSCDASKSSSSSPFQTLSLHEDANVACMHFNECSLVNADESCSESCSEVNTDESCSESCSNSTNDELLICVTDNGKLNLFSV